jgi:single-strand DNA-binding protein
MNFTTITGKLVRNPFLKFTSSGQPIADFSIATRRRWRDSATQEWQESTTYVEVTAWGDLARNAAESLREGHRITVNGRLEQRGWETQGGEKRSQLEIAAHDIAASMRFATMVITKAEQQDDQGEDEVDF